MKSEQIEGKSLHTQSIASKNSAGNTFYKMSQSDWIRGMIIKEILDVPRSKQKKIR